MPFCEVGKSQPSGVYAARNDGIKIFHRTYGHGPIKVLMIIGLAGTHDSWAPQIKRLGGTLGSNDDQDESSADDRSSSENDSSANDRSSEENGGGLENKNYGKRCNSCNGSFGLEKSSHPWPFNGSYASLQKLLSRGLLLTWIPITQKEYLEEYVGTKTRRAVLYREYVKGILSTGMQSNYGFDGHINACWTHKLTESEFKLIRSAGFLISVIHGRDDIIAQLCHARRLAEKLYPSARMVELHGGHLVSHERVDQAQWWSLSIVS